MSGTTVIIVGGGLAGLSAAHTVLERGGRVLLLDKSKFLGGNSTKATSGINGANTQAQARAGVKDSVDLFIEDTSKSARDLARPDLIGVLCGQSGPAVEWLQGAPFNLDLSLVSRLGGHSAPRTHRGKERFPGMTITYGLMEALEDAEKRDPARVRVRVQCRVTELLQPGGAGHPVVGVAFHDASTGQTERAYGPVVLATGGYGADFSASSLLAQYRPDVMDLSTTNGPHCTGDGLKMAQAAGAGLVDMECVQVHPTGLVDPAEPDAKVKFLAAEALRGVGGLLLDNQGERFCNELGHRDYVTGEMQKRARGPYRLVLNGAAAKEIEWHCKHYVGRGLMKVCRSGDELAREMGVPPGHLQQTFDQYNGFASAKNDPWGKQYFNNLPLRMDDVFHVAVVTPLVHYTMGGVETLADASLATNGRPIPGLFGAGEMMGGTHGRNRLGGSSLLDCVVFGRVAGNSASRYLLSSLSTAGGAALGAEGGAPGAGAPVHATISMTPGANNVNLQLSWGAAGGGAAPVAQSAPAAAAPAPAAGKAAAAATKAAAPAAAAAAPSAGEYTMEEVAKHTSENDCWVVVNGQVLDVTSFLDDHPGGKKAIMIYAGRDASEEFNMLHKPDVVDKYAPECVIGTLKPKSKM